MFETIVTNNCIVLLKNVTSVKMFKSVEAFYTYCKKKDFTNLMIIYQLP